MEKSSISIIITSLGQTGFGFFSDDVEEVVDLRQIRKVKKNYIPAHVVMTHLLFRDQEIPIFTLDKLLALENNNERYQYGVILRDKKTNSLFGIAIAKRIDLKEAEIKDILLVPDFIKLKQRTACSPAVYFGTGENVILISLTDIPLAALISGMKG